MRLPPSKQQQDGFKRTWLKWKTDTNVPRGGGKKKNKTQKNKMKSSHKHFTAAQYFARRGKVWGGEGGGAKAQSGY